MSQHTSCCWILYWIRYFGEAANLCRAAGKAGSNIWPLEGLASAYLSLRWDIGKHERQQWGQGCPGREPGLSAD